MPERRFFCGPAIVEDHLVNSATGGELLRGLPVSIYRRISHMYSPFAGAQGTLQLLTETDPVSEVIRRNVRLESAGDGRSVLLVDLDLRRPGIQREYRIEITAGELIALIRGQGRLADMPPVA
jgi:hypothetical protein